MGKGKQLTIGLLISGITDNFTVSVCRGAINAAKEAGVKLVIFPGKYLDRDCSERQEVFYEYQYNVVFSFAKKETLDAILVSANTIGCFTTVKRMKKMLEQYTGIPCVLIASKIEGYVSVNFDNSSGIKEAVNYLVQELKCTRLGMIGGPDTNTDSYERKTAFIQALAAHGISLPDKRYIEGDLSRFPRSTFHTFLKQNPDMEAVFCANDDTAIGLYDVLKEQNIIPGKQLYIFGYDNIPYAANMKPSLSSVWADPVKLGNDSLEMICKMLHGENVESQVLTTRFIIRESLGSKEIKIDKNIKNKLDKNYIDTIFNDVFYRYPSGKDEAEYTKLKESFQSFMNLLLTHYTCDEPEPISAQLAPDLDDFLSNQNVLDYADVDKFIEHIENMNLATGNAHTSLSSTIYRKLIHAIKQQHGEITAAQINQQYSIMLFVKDIMSFQSGNDQSYTVLLEHLDWLNIQNASIYIYEKPIFHLFKEDFHLPDKLYLKAALQEGIVQSIPASSQEINSCEIYTNQYTSQNTLPQVLFPLYSNEMIYGVLLCDMTEQLSKNGDFFVNQMSSAVKMIHLLKNNDIIQQRLEDSLATLKKNNIVLDTLTKCDALTGILNRRGFLDAAEKFLEQNKAHHLNTTVAYIDMNNLKIVNDRYGHDEGDYSLKIIGELLEKAASGKGFAGRIGGDEFALIIVSGTDDDLLEQIYTQFEVFNQESSKPYQITVSAGIYKITANNPSTLSDALTHADEELYREKQHRRKNIDK